MKNRNAALKNRNDELEREVNTLRTLAEVLTSAINTPPLPIPMFLTCPMCLARHIDEGVFATKPHHTHSCQICGLTWRPAVCTTVGVQFLPGFKDDRK